MNSCDCVVVGGGPAGSSCARALVQAGLDVIVLDKSKFPRDKVCAGWITPAVIDELEIDLAEYRQGRTLQPFTGFRTGLLGSSQIETRYDHVVSYGIRRCEFDQFLLERSGAKLQLGLPLAELRREMSQWIVNNSVRTPLIIGAGGHFCPVARLMARERGDESTIVFAQEAEFEMSAAEAAACRIAPETPELFFCKDLRGYAWCVRKESFLNIGLGREADRNLSAHLVAFLESLQEQGRLPRGIRPRFRGHAYRLYSGDLRRVVADGVLLIGDAAGLACVQSGEGIRPAIESGLMAAQEIVAVKGDYRRDQLGNFPRRLEARFGCPSKASRHGFPFERLRSALARRLLSTRWFTRRVVLDRWFLRANQAPLPLPGHALDDRERLAGQRSPGKGRPRGLRELFIVWRHRQAR